MPPSHTFLQRITHPFTPSSSSSPSHEWLRMDSKQNANRLRDSDKDARRMRVEEVARNGSNTTTVEGVNDDETVIPGDEMDEGRERVLGENDHGHFGESGRGGSYSHTHFRVYKRRWFGLAQLVLLNVVVSWDWLSFAPVSTSSAEYFNVSETAINWLSTAFMFSFVVVAPLVVYTLHHGPKQSIISASVLILLGNWIRYAGTRGGGGKYGVVMFGQILTGLAQPFVLAAPTRYSDLWFTESGRVSATAVASLANPLGGALAQLINPAFVSKPSDIPNMVLYVAIISTAASLPSFFIPSTPPTPASSSSSIPKTPLSKSLSLISHSPTFFLISIPYGIYVGFFNAFSSLLNQILYPYGYSEAESGICGALLIVVGLVSSAITSPILDRTHSYLLAIKVVVPVCSLTYLAFIWAPQTGTLVAPYLLASVLGATSFSLVPIVLEYLVEVTYPASPEVGSTVCWGMGQALGGIFIVIENALKEGTAVTKELKGGRGHAGTRPPGNMRRALIFQAVLALLVVPFVMVIGVGRLGLGEGKVAGRLAVDERGDGDGDGGARRTDS